MAEQLTIEQADKQLNDIIKKMENSRLSLSESVSLYEEAAKLLEFCYKQLDDCRLRITDINERIEALEKSGDIFDE